MASIRKLKKDINVLTFDLLSKCYALKHVDPGINEDKFDEIIRKIVFLRNDLVLRVNHPETDGESTNMSAHYRKVKEDLYEMLKTIDDLDKTKKA